jgi:SAM-dependent methyltransferase
MGSKTTHISEGERDGDQMTFPFLRDYPSVAGRRVFGQNIIPFIGKADARQLTFPFIGDYPLAEGEWGPGQKILPSALFHSRPCVQKAYEDMMVGLFDGYFPAGGFVADVGPGSGFPYEVLPDRIRRNIILVEWNPTYVKELSRRFPNADIRRANAYSLPFLPGSMDGIFGLGSYDTLVDIDKAVSSLAKSLKKNGVFMHILDTNPDPCAIREWMKREGKSFPKVILGNQVRGATGIGEDDWYFESQDTLREYDEARRSDSSEFGSEINIPALKGGVLWMS